MRDILVCDAETDPFSSARLEIKPFVWGIIDKEDNFVYWWNNEKAFIEYLKNQDAIVYAHNGGKFDWQFLKEYVEEGSNIMEISGRIAKLEMGRAELRDSMNLFPFGLAQYQKEKFDYTKMDKSKREKFKQEILKYLESDLRNLKKLLMPCIEKYGLHLTQASMAYSEWRKMTKMKMTLSEEYDGIYRPFYYGGRVQAFTRGSIDFETECFDINSAYPYAMLSKHPFSSLPPIISEKLPSSKGAIQRSFIEIEAESNGAFLMETKKGQFFPSDKTIRTFNITGWEFLAAKDLGLLKKFKILKVIQSAGTLDFKDYVYRFYEEKVAAKLKGDKNAEVYAKIFLNALYGKTSSNYRNYRQEILVHPSRIQFNKVFGGYNQKCPFGNLFLMDKALDESKMYFKNVAVGASITGFVRAYLLRAIYSVSSPIYCDTDSIFCRAGKNLKLDNELGNWKSEGCFDFGGIVGKKIYAFHKKGKPLTFDKDEPDENWKIASKGFEGTPKQILDLAAGKIKEINYKREAPSISTVNGFRYLDRTIKMLPEFEFSV